MTTSRLNAWTIAWLLAAAFWNNEHLGANAAEAQTIRIGVTQFGAELGTRGFYTIPFEVAQRHGYFKAESVDIEFVPFGGPTVIDTLWNEYAGLAKGEVNLIRTQSPFLIEQVMKGGDFVGIAANTINPVQVLVASADIKSFSDLKGKAVALAIPNDTITVAALKVLELHGVSPGDVTVRHIEGSKPRLACLTSGQCAAAAVQQPTDHTAVAQGYHRIGTINEAGRLVFGVDVVANSWARAHQDVLVRYIRAMASALRYANDPMNDAEMLKLFMQINKADENAARDMLQSHRDPNYRVLSRQGEIDPGGFAHTIALLDQFGELPKPLPDVGRFLDQRYLIAAGIRN